MAQTTNSPLVAKASTSATSLQETVKSLTEEVSKLQTSRKALVESRRAEAKKEAEERTAKRAELKSVKASLKKEAAADIAALSESQASMQGMVSGTAAEHEAKRQVILAEYAAKVKQAEKEARDAITKVQAEVAQRARAETEAVESLNEARAAVVATKKALLREERRLKATERDTVASRIVNWVQDNVVSRLQ